MIKMEGDNSEPLNIFFIYLPKWKLPLSKKNKWLADIFYRFFLLFFDENKRSLLICLCASQKGKNNELWEIEREEMNSISWWSEGRCFFAYNPKSCKGKITSFFRIFQTSRIKSYWENLTVEWLSPRYFAGIGLWFREIFMTIDKVEHGKIKF